MESRNMILNKHTHELILSINWDKN